MGDRCYVSLTCREQDVSKFEELGFEREKWPSEGKEVGVAIVGQEMNYAATSELEELAHAGIPFYGAHGSGDEYGEMLFASAHGESLWISHCNYLPVVTVEPDLTISKEDMEYVALYYRLEAAAKALIAAAHVERQAYLVDIAQGE